MNTPAEERIIAKQKEAVRADLELQEAHWLCRKIGIAVLNFPQVLRKTLLFVIEPEVEALQAENAALHVEVNYLRAELAKVNQRLNAAGKLVKAIDERTRGHKPAQPPRR